MVPARLMKDQRAPCFAAMGAIKREMNNAKWTWAAIGYMCGFAYVASLIVYQLGGQAGNGRHSGLPVPEAKRNEDYCDHAAHRSQQGGVAVLHPAKAVVVLAVRSLRKSHKSGEGCNGDCGNCHGCH